MNTDKIYAEAIANEYAPKDTSKVVALKKLDRKQTYLLILLELRRRLFSEQGCAFLWMLSETEALLLRLSG